MNEKKSILFADLQLRISGLHFQCYAIGEQKEILCDDCIFNAAVCCGGHTYDADWHAIKTMDLQPDAQVTIEMLEKHLHRPLEFYLQDANAVKN